MKMDRQNPGGQGDLQKSMKGSETYQAQGKADMKSYPVPSPMKKQTVNSPAKIEGMSMGGAVRSTAHSHTSMSGDIGPVGTSKANS